MKKFFLWLLFYCCFIQAAPPIVYVHLGFNLPPYLSVAIDQARLFNPESPIYLIANRLALRSSPSFISDNRVEWVPVESLIPSEAHQQFIAKTPLRGFWRYAIERLFYLEEWMVQKELTHVFHTENDVMIYTDLSQQETLFEAIYSGKIGATFDNDARCIAGFLYISDLQSIQQLIRYIASNARRGKNDMEALSDFRSVDGGKWIGYLPIVTPAYSFDRPLQATNGSTTKTPDLYSSHFESFQMIFDAAALGQYWGGIDPIHRANSAGFINETCLFNPSLFQFHWQLDEKGRFCPYLTYNGASWPIANLHIHSKNLQLFHSSQPAPQPPPFGL